MERGEEAQVRYRAVSIEQSFEDRLTSHDLRQS